MAWAAVFNLLRGWSTGAMPMAEVRRRLDECIQVLFIEPPSLHRGLTLVAPTTEPAPPPEPEACRVEGFVQLCAACGVDAADARRIHAGLVARHRGRNRRYHPSTTCRGARPPRHDGEGIDDRRAPGARHLVPRRRGRPPQGRQRGASAALAGSELLAAGADPDVVDDVVRLVAVTSDHHGTTADEWALVDADLAVLGAGPTATPPTRPRCARSTAWLDDELWTVGRAAVLTVAARRRARPFPLACVRRSRRAGPPKPRRRARRPRARAEVRAPML